MRRRHREYVLFASARGGPFTTHTACYGRGTHPFMYRVWAVSIKQAYYLAAHEVFAPDARSLGVREISRHGDYPSVRGAA